MTDASLATVELASGDLKDRSRKVNKKKLLRKEPSSSEVQSNAEQSSAWLGHDLPEQVHESVDASEAPENNASDDPHDVCLEQLEEVVSRSMGDGDSAHHLSPFILPESSSCSDLAEFLFLDDLSATPKEEEFKVIQRKKKTKTNQQGITHFGADQNKKNRIKKLEQCQEFIEKQVVSKVTESILTYGLKSDDSFSNSVSVSTFASLSSSVRSSSPINNTDVEECLILHEPPITTADVVSVLNNENVDCCVIPGVNLCTRLGYELDYSGFKAKSMDERVIGDIVLTDEYATADDEVSFCHPANGHYASPQVNGAFVSDPGYPDIVTSTISEFSVSKSLEAFRWIPDMRPKVSLPQPDDIAEAGVNYLCLIQSGSTSSNAESRDNHQSKDAIVFGDFPSRELEPQDKSYCDTKSVARQMNFKFPMSYSRLRSSRCQMKAKLSNELVGLELKDNGMCSNPVVFVNCVTEAAFDPEISFGFDSSEDEAECGSHFCNDSTTIGVSAGSSKRGICLPDLVDPAVVQHSNSLVTGSASTTAVCFDVCDADNMQSLKSDSKSFHLNGVDCHVSVPSASSDSSTTVPGDSEVASSWSDFRLPTKVCNSVSKTREKFCISSKWNGHPETARTKRNGHESCHNKHSSFLMKESASHSHLSMCPSEKPQKKPTINSWKQRDGEFDLYVTQAFLWKSFQETLEEQGCVYLQCDGNHFEKDDTKNLVTVATL